MSRLPSRCSSRPTRRSDSVETSLQQAAELALQAGNGTLTDSARATIATQLKGVLDDLVKLANTTDARGQPLFGAATGDTAVTVGTDGSVSFSGTGTPRPSRSATTNRSSRPTPRRACSAG